MKKIALLLLCCLIVKPAFAVSPLRSGFYVNAKVGAIRSEVKTEDKKRHDVAFPGAIALGARVRYFRVEAEYMFSTEAKMGDYKQEIEMVSGQLYYDVPFKTKIRPFANAGWGYQRTKLKKDKSFSEKKDGSVWNVGGGLTWNLSNAVNLDLGYRCIFLGKFKTRDGDVKTNNHMIYLGWRYVF